MLHGMPGLKWKGQSPATHNVDFRCSWQSMGAVAPKLKREALLTRVNPSGRRLANLLTAVDAVQP